MLRRVGSLMRLTLTDPRAAARVLMQDEAALGQAVPIALAVVGFGVMLSFIMAQLMPGPEFPMLDFLLGNPLLYAGFQFILLLFSVVAIFAVGRMFGGTGRFQQALLLMSWVQFFMLVVQIVAVGVMLLVPSAGILLNYAIMVNFIWLMVVFITELHGFTSRLKVLGGMIGTAFVVAFLASALLSALGIGISVQGL